MSDDSGSGIRNFLVGLLFFILLVWGPIDRSWPFWPLGIRLLYLISIPAMWWFVLGWIWRLWRPDQTDEDRLRRTIAGAVAGALFVGALLETQRSHHFVC